MNAIIGLCHFCEAHGPRPLFCTFATDNEKHTVEPSQSPAQCSGCTSLGSDTVLISKENNGTVYCSRESVPNNEVTAFLRHAAIRSITCEVSWTKEGGIVYFGDPRGHVLSLTFQLKDTRARGLKRWFSIVVLMKDKMLLLNITPVLSDHMKKIAKELQVATENVYDEEQKICSQRALRLNTGRNDFGPSRSLTQLTGDNDIFKKLHSNFTWMLNAGALTYTETLYTSKDLLKKLNINQDFSSINEKSHCMGLRSLQKLLGKDVFHNLLYCTLTGVNIVIKMNTDSHSIIPSLLQLLPTTNNVNNIRYSHVNEEICNMDCTCVLEECNNNFKCDWSVPNKCPTLMNRIENAINNNGFKDDVLYQHIKSMQLEWLGTIRTLKAASETSKSTEAVVKLKQVLGITKQDEPLINYWNKTFCT